MKAKIRIAFCFYILYLCGSFALSAQCTSVILKGVVKDENQNIVSNASIQYVNAGTGVNVNPDGSFLLHINLPAKIQISSLGYLPQQKTFSQSANCDTLKVMFTLKLDIKQIPMVNIYSNQRLQCIASADNLLDFELKDGDLCILDDLAKGRRINIFDSTAKLVARRDVKYKVDELYRTQNNLVFFADDDSIHFLGWDNSNGRTAEYPMPLNEYHSQIAPVLAMDPPQYYYAKNERLNGGASFWIYNKFTDSLKLLYKYYNKKMAQLNVENRNYKEGLKGAITDDDGFSTLMTNSNLTAEGLKSGREIQAALWSAWIFDHDASVILRYVRDSIYIFNFENDSLYVFNRKNKFIRSIVLGFEFKGLKYDRKDIIVNEHRNACYFSYNIHGVCYVDNLDLDNGKKVSSNKLQFPFVKKIRVDGNYATYSYTDPAAKTYIYRQRLE